MSVRANAVLGARFDGTCWDLSSPAMWPRGLRRISGYISIYAHKRLYLCRGLVVVALGVVLIAKLAY